MGKQGVPSWNALPVGTRRPNGHGYILVKVAGTPTRWKLEHRVIWEAIHGPIPAGHTIHHVNENKTDNRPENMTLCASNGEHHRLYHAEKHRANVGHLGQQAVKGVPKSPEHRAAIAAALRGKKKGPNPARAAAWQRWRDQRGQEKWR